MAAKSRVLKVNFNGDLRRWTVDPTEFSIGELEKKVREVYDIKLFTIKYIDEDGDQVSVETQDDLEECFAQDVRPIRMFVSTGAFEQNTQPVDSGSNGSSTKEDAPKHQFEAGSGSAPSGFPNVFETFLPHLIAVSEGKKAPAELIPEFFQAACKSNGKGNGSSKAQGAAAATPQAHSSPPKSTPDNTASGSSTGATGSGSSFPGGCGSGTAAPNKFQHVLQKLIPHLQEVSEGKKAPQGAFMEFMQAMKSTDEENGGGGGSEASSQACGEQRDGSGTNAQEFGRSFFSPDGGAADSCPLTSPNLGCGGSAPPGACAAAPPKLQNFLGKLIPHLQEVSDGKAPKECFMDFMHSLCNKDGEGQSAAASAAAAAAAVPHPAGVDGQQHPLGEEKVDAQDQPAGGEDAVHFGVTCDGCDAHPIVGPRFKSLTKADFDLCKKCEANNDPQWNDLYMRIDRPQDANRQINDASKQGIFWGRERGYGCHRGRRAGRGSGMGVGSAVPFPGGGSGRWHNNAGEGLGFGGHCGMMKGMRGFKRDWKDWKQQQQQGAAGGAGASGLGGCRAFWPHHAGAARKACHKAWKMHHHQHHQGGATGDDTPIMQQDLAALFGKLDARFVVDVTVFDGTEISAGSQFLKVWRMRNTGGVPWPQGTRLVQVGGDLLGVENPASLVSPSAASVQGLEPEQEVDLALEMQAPTQPGRYVAYYRLAAPNGPKFGQRIWAFIQVTPEDDFSTAPSAPPIVEPNMQQATPQKSSPSPPLGLGGVAQLPVRSPVPKMENNNQSPMRSGSSASVNSQEAVGLTQLIPQPSAPPATKTAQGDLLLMPCVDINGTSEGAEEATVKSQLNLPVQGGKRSVEDQAVVAPAALGREDQEQGQKQDAVEVMEGALAQLRELGFMEEDWNRVVLAKNSNDISKCVNEILAINAQDEPTDTKPTPLKNAATEGTPQDDKEYTPFVTEEEVDQFWDEMLVQEVLSEAIQGENTADKGKDKMVSGEVSQTKATADSDDVIVLQPTEESFAKKADADADEAEADAKNEGDDGKVDGADVNEGPNSSSIYVDAPVQQNWVDECGPKEEEDAEDDGWEAI